jgi:hypothetical protein
MDADHFERLGQLSGYVIDFRRLALTRDQVEEHDLPPNPVKEADTRSAEYEEEHGGGCWELDALDPSIIGRLVNDGIKSVIDLEEWNKGLAAEEAIQNKLREELKAFAENFVCDIGYGKDRDRTIKVQRWGDLQAERKQMMEEASVLLGLKQPFVSYRRPRGP